MRGHSRWRCCRTAAACRRGRSRDDRRRCAQAGDRRTRPVLDARLGTSHPDGSCRSGRALVTPPVTAVLLNSVPTQRARTASGVFYTSRQVGGALAVAVFGALLANRATFVQGLRTSLLLAAGVPLAAAAASLLLKP